jgi:hypothetical protein
MVRRYSPHCGVRCVGHSIARREAILTACDADVLFAVWTRPRAAMSLIAWQRTWLSRISMLAFPYRHERVDG